jgi:glycosyltransferase involved in cell wall biosynthesis
MRACDAFVRPTRADGDAVSVREALAVGCAVIASAVGHRPAGCTLFPVGDADALARRMAAHAAAPNLARDRPSEVSGPDPFQTLHALYRALWTGRPLPSGGQEQERAPTF